MSSSASWPGAGDGKRMMRRHDRSRFRHRARRAGSRRPSKSERRRVAQAERFRNVRAQASRDVARGRALARHEQHRVARSPLRRARPTSATVASSSNFAIDDFHSSTVGDPDQAARAEALRRLRQRVEIAARERRAAGIAHRDHPARLVAGVGFEKIDLRAGERGVDVAQFEPEPQVRLVAAEAAHRFGVREPRQRARQLDAERLPPHVCDAVLHRRHDVVFLDEATSRRRVA